jgi:hypothetical protein
MEKKQFEQIVKGIIEESFITLVKSKRLKLNKVLTIINLQEIYLINHDYLDIVCKLYIDDADFESDNDYKEVVEKRNELLQKISEKIKIPKRFNQLSDNEKQVKDDLNESCEKIVNLSDFLKEIIDDANKSDANNFVFHKFLDRLNLEIKLVLTMNYAYNDNFSENSLSHFKNIAHKILDLQEEINKLTE